MKGGRERGEGRGRKRKVTNTCLASLLSGGGGTSLTSKVFQFSLRKFLKGYLLKKKKGSRECKNLCITNGKI